MLPREQKARQSWHKKGTPPYINIIVNEIEMRVACQARAGPSLALFVTLVHVRTLFVVFVYTTVLVVVVGAFG